MKSHAKNKDIFLWLRTHNNVIASFCDPLDLVSNQSSWPHSFSSGFLLLLHNPLGTLWFFTQPAEKKESHKTRNNFPSRCSPSVFAFAFFQLLLLLLRPTSKTTYFAHTTQGSLIIALSLHQWLNRRRRRRQHSNPDSRVSPMGILLRTRESRTNRTTHDTSAENSSLENSLYSRSRPRQIYIQLKYLLAADEYTL